MVKMRGTSRIPHFIAASLMLVLLTSLFQIACVRDFWVEVPPLHPGDMTAAELDVWQAELGRINGALQEINDEHEYKRKEYECDSFSDYTAQELAKECFTVKRAMSYTFEFPDGRTGVHHWLFVITEVGDREGWVPVECTPPNGERQKQYESDCCDASDGQCPAARIEQFPRVATETYSYLATAEQALGERFDESYFGTIIVWGVTPMPKCTENSLMGGGACSPGRAAILAR
ncbi:MAG: hypothetical protein ACLFVD_06685 [Dehalococcoidia bacterium]